MTALNGTLDRKQQTQRKRLCAVCSRVPRISRANYLHERSTLRLHQWDEAVHQINIKISGETYVQRHGHGKRAFGTDISSRERAKTTPRRAALHIQELVTF